MTHMTPEQRLAAGAGIRRPTTIPSGIFPYPPTTYRMPADDGGEVAIAVER
ncbi:MAG: hypothetical protein ACRDJE_11860 [Dehalococcoidia bacterium]